MLYALMLVARPLCLDLGTSFLHAYTSLQGPAMPWPADVCVDRPAVFAQLKDEEGNGAIHVASREGYAHIIKAQGASK